MAIDTSIYNSLLRPVKSVAEYDAEADQREQNKLALMLSRTKADDYQRERAGESKLAELLARGGTPDQIGADLARSGFASQALAFTKQQQEIEKSKAEAGYKAAQTGKLASETGKIDYDLREEKRKKAMTDIAAFTSGDQALASLDLHEKAGDIAPEQAALIRQTIPTNPADFPKWQLGMLQRIMSAKEGAGYVAPDANTVANNNTSIANNKSTNARIAADNAASRAQSDRQFNIRESREAAAPRGQVIQTDQGPILVDPRTGVGKDITGPDGKPVTKTKPLPNSVVKQVQEVRDNAVTLSRLNSSFKDDFAGKGVFGVGADMQLSAAGTLGKDQDSVAWWKDYRKSAELVERHALFGAALTPTEQASWRNADIGPGMDAKTIKRNLATRATLAEKVRNTTRDDMIDAGHNADRVRAIAGREAQQEAPAAVKPYADSEKERRYQEWKRSQGK